jgi:F-type H+-transporting ATPase subunit b
VNEVTQPVFYLAEEINELQQEVTETHTEQPAKHESTSPMKAEPPLWIWTALAFVVVFLVLNKIAFPRITQLIDERNNKIEGDLKNAELTREEAEKMLAQYKAQLDEARTEAKKIMDEGKLLGENLRKEAMKKAADEANQLIKRAQDEITREMEKAMKELRSQIADISIQVASKVIQKSLDKEEHAKLIDQYITEVGNIYEG